MTAPLRHAAPVRTVTLALDAGGTTLKAALLEDGRLLPHLRIVQPSCSERETHVIIANFANVCMELLGAYEAARHPSRARSTQDEVGVAIADRTPFSARQKAITPTNKRADAARPYTTVEHTEHIRARGMIRAAAPVRPTTPSYKVRIGFAFPGPFDYENGVALLQGVSKYERLYGMNVGELLQRELRRRASLRTAQAWVRRLAEADIRFANDASLFALGVSRLYPSERLICLTLGTGLGSGFVDHGKLVEGRDGVPPSGMLYAERYRHAAVDEQFGRRGLIALADIYGARRHPQQDVQELALAARVGDKRAADAWAEYGFHLGRMLAPYTARFKPDRLVLGGQIAKSCDLWLPYLEVSLGNPAPVVTHQGDLMEHVFEGIELLFR